MRKKEHTREIKFSFEKEIDVTEILLKLVAQVPAKELLQRFAVSLEVAAGLGQTPQNDKDSFEVIKRLMYIMKNYSNLQKEVDDCYETLLRKD
jgi:hypothetical protein